MAIGKGQDLHYIMDNKVLDRIVTMLETAEDFYVPVKKLWKELYQEGCVMFSYEDFIQKLDQDERFELRDFKKAWGDDEEAEMEELGYYSGPRIKLKARKITKEDIQRIALRHAKNTIDNLVKAYKVKPEDLPPEAEDELIELMRKSKELKEKIDTIFHSDTDNDRTNINSEDI